MTIRPSTATREADEATRPVPSEGWGKLLTLVNTIEEQAALGLDLLRDLLPAGVPAGTLHDAVVATAREIVRAYYTEDRRALSQAVLAMTNHLRAIDGAEPVVGVLTASLRTGDVGLGVEGRGDLLELSAGFGLDDEALAALEAELIPDRYR